MYSSPATVTVQSKPWVEADPASLLVGVGDTASLTVEAYGSGPLAYQWYKLVNKKPAQLDGANGSSLNFDSATLEDAGQYLVEVSNSSGTAWSGKAVLTVHEKPAFNTQPQDATAIVGKAVELNFSVKGTPKLSYQWFKDGKAFGKPSSKTSLRISKAGDDFVGNYHVVATNAVGKATSAAATLNVIHPPKLLSELEDNFTMVEGQTFALEPSFTGTLPISYTWSQGKPHSRPRVPQN